MSWVFFKIKESNFLSPSQPPYFLPQSLPTPSPISNSQSSDFNLNKVSPSILLIIIILAIIFFISGLLHLLIRFILRPQNRDPDDFENVTAHQGQLQQLFNLHDSGVDQSFIDTLPVFNYKSIVGVKYPFDCAVCLCEFEGEDKLRLLPKCSHAFHMECIDIWLLSHSTCPICRACLVPDFSQNTSNSFSPLVLVLESASESSRESVCDRDGFITRANSHLGFNEFGSTRIDFSDKSCEIQSKSGENQEKVVTVKLGKFKNVDNGGESSSNNVNVDERRCFSMGSFEYVMDENSKLQVPIRTPMKKPPSKKTNLPLTPGHRLAMSECDCDSRREFNGFESFKSVGNSSEIEGSKRESFSISKIWVRGKKDRPVVGSSRRAFSFRFPVHRNVDAGDDLKVKNGGSGTRRTISEIDMRGWENGERELGCDVEIQRCNSLENQTNAPSFARRTLLWLVGRQNKVVHSSFSPNV